MNEGDRMDKRMTMLIVLAGALFLLNRNEADVNRDGSYTDSDKTLLIVAGLIGAGLILR